MKFVFLVVLGVVLVTGNAYPDLNYPLTDDRFYGVDNVRAEPENVLVETENDGLHGENEVFEYAGARAERFRRETSAEVDGPSEYNWEHQKRSVAEEPAESSPSPATEGKTATQEPGQRKTIIPLEGIVFAKIKDNHLVRPKLTSRIYASSTHKLKNKVPLKRARVGAAARRFDLYPRWYSRSIPSLFGKRFARRYYKPYQRSQPQSVGGQARHIIGRHRKPHIRSGSVFHELPLSWVTGAGRDSIPKENHREGMYDYDNYANYAKNFDETKLEGMEGDEGMVMNPQTASKGHHVSGGSGGDKKSLPFLKDLPHEIMSELNPYEYTVTPDHDNSVRRSHHFTTRAHAHHLLPRTAHVVTSLDAPVAAHDGWTDYHALPHGHHHRHKLNPCYHNPCLNHGRCHFNNGGNFRCLCKEGFSGDICDRTPFSCHPNPCYNGGTCTVLQSGYFCTCLPGFRGRDCENQNPCASNPCLNNGKCTDTADGYFCTCGKGFSGPACGEEVQRAEDQATDDILADHSVREQHELDHELETLSAHDHLNGIHAGPGHHAAAHGDRVTSVTSLPVNSIQSPLQQHANSIPLPLSTDGCTLACKNGGHCEKSMGAYGCVCPSGFTGDLCEVRSATPVPEGATRERLSISGPPLPSPRLTTTTTAPPSPYDCIRVPCKHGGTCVETVDNNIVQHLCTCNVGFVGVDCGTALPGHEDVVHDTETVHPATIGHSDVLVHGDTVGHGDVISHGDAASHDVPFTCSSGLCKNGGTCVKGMTGTVETTVCSCPVGFGGNDCGSPDLCTPNPCENGASCVQEGEENYKCVCLDGFKGTDCHLSNHCTHDLCKNGGACEETPDSYRCKCMSGYKGPDCGQLSPCQVNPCSNKGTCIEKGLAFVCNCPLGFMGNTCDVKDQCYPNPCVNGACRVDLGSPTCNCTKGWSGNFCDRADACSSSPCVNGGICETIGAHFRCRCPLGFQGPSCELPDPCSSNPCSNGGACNQEGTAFTCKCQTGFHGERCHLKAHCQPSPCNNHGECFESDEGFICECNPRYMGKFCEVVRNCYDNPCLNGGHCVENENTFVCECPFGYRGKQCSANVCDSRPCQNGGTCIPAENDVGYGCECVFPYHGITCGEMDPCLTNPCRNGGTCQSQLQGGLLTSLSHMSVFGPYDCGPYDTESHCSQGGGQTAPAHHQEMFNEHEVDHQSEFPQEAHGITHVNDDYNKPSYDRNDHFEKDDEELEKDKQMSVFDKDKDMAAAPPMDKNKSVFEKALMDTEKDVRFDKAPSKGYMDNDKDAGLGDKSSSSSMHLAATDVDKDAHVSSFSGKTGQSDMGGDKGVSLDGSKSEFLTKAENDHTGLLDKVDYYPKHRVESPSGGGGVDMNMKDLPDCPCNPQPCMWPPTCKPQLCTPPCKRHYNENEQLHFMDTYHKRTINSPENSTLDEPRLRRSLPRRMTRNIYSRRYNKKEISRRDASDESDDDDEGDDENEEGNDLTKLTTKEILGMKRDSIMDVKASKRLEIIPKVIINFRHPGETDVYKRTMHELYVCQCPPGFLGAHCQHMNPCRASPCTNGGSCIPRGDRYVCQCLPGFGGRHCDDPHPCTPNPCTHGGRCHLAKSVRGYECKCKNGWRGYNCEDRDQCAANNPCRHDGTCINIDGSDGVECKCRTRYSGKHCEVDTCAACDMNAYCHHGNCVCEAGYFGNGFRCKAMTDICTPNPCDNKGECKPGLDGKLFTCECQPGYVGSRCELPHPCANNPCLHNGACVDESNSKDRGILLLDRNDYKCFCSAGYKGKNCGETSLAACSSGPCQHNGTCFDSSSETHSKHLTHTEDYECFCAMGYTGKNCEITHYACYSYPCMNGGTCLDAESLPDINFDAHGYKCNCNHGFIGRNCEVTVYGPGACHQSPCLNNGRCVDAMNSNDPDIHFDYEHQFKCICPAQYSGKICEVPYPACFSNPCHNKGICSDRTKEPNGVFDETGYTCTCLAGYDGRNCERQNSLAIIDAPEVDTKDVALDVKPDGKTDDAVAELHDNPKAPEGKKDDAKPIGNDAGLSLENQKIEKDGSPTNDKGSGNGDELQNRIKMQLEESWLKKVLSLEGAEKGEDLNSRKKENTKKEESISRNKMKFEEMLSFQENAKKEPNIRNKLHFEEMLIHKGNGKGEESNSRNKMQMGKMPSPPSFKSLKRHLPAPFLNPIPSIDHRNPLMHPKW